MSKTLEQQATERADIASQNWNPAIADLVHDSFLAGAAAMAELFVSGKALKVEQTPRKYFIAWEFVNQKDELVRSCWIATAFDRNEAIRQAGFTSETAWQLIVRPATEEDENIEGIKRV